MTTTRVSATLAFALLSACHGGAPRPEGPTVAGAPSTSGAAASTSAIPSAPPAPSSGATATTIDCARAFEPPPGAEALCEEHVMGQGAEIHWRSFAVDDEPGAVEARYRAYVEPCGLKVLEGERLTLLAGDHHLAIGKVDDATAPRCAKAPSPGRKTLLVESRLITRPKR